MNRGRVLVVDDDPIIRMLLTRVLEREQLEVQLQHLISVGLALLQLQQLAAKAREPGLQLRDR